MRPHAPIATFDTEAEARHAASVLTAKGATRRYSIKAYRADSGTRYALKVPEGNALKCERVLTTQAW